MESVCTDIDKGRTVTLTLRKAYKFGQTGYILLEKIQDMFDENELDIGTITPFFENPEDQNQIKIAIATFRNSQNFRRFFESGLFGRLIDNQVWVEMRTLK
jgi:hypothetical protein